MAKLSRSILVYNIGPKFWIFNFLFIIQKRKRKKMTLYEYNYFYATHSRSGIFSLTVDKM